jgi:hypothetical protein
MKSVEEIVAPPSPYKGSEKSYASVKSQVEAIWGKEEAEKYDPYVTRTFVQWLKAGYIVKKGQQGLRATTYIESKDPSGNVVKLIPRTVCLFLPFQVQRDPKAMASV